MRFHRSRLDPIASQFNTFHTHTLQVFRLKLHMHFPQVSFYMQCSSYPSIWSLPNVAKSPNYESPCYVTFSAVFYFLYAKISSCGTLFSDIHNLYPFITVKDQILSLI
jgi:hypothetical protein